MTYIPANPPLTRWRMTGIWAWVHVIDDGRSNWLINFDLNAQNEYFGGSLEGRSMFVKFGSGSNQGLVKIGTTGRNMTGLVAAPVTDYAENSAVQIICANPDGIQGAYWAEQECNFVSEDASGVIIRLPEIPHDSF